MHSNILFLLVSTISVSSQVVAAPSAGKRLRAARRDAPPKLTEALKAAAKVQCTDPTFKESQDNDPGTQWRAAGAEDLLEAAIQSFRQDARGNYDSLTAYLAELFGTDDSTFDCSDDRSNNECTGWGPANHNCDQEVGPAGKMILDSVSWINNFYAPIDNDLTKAGLAGLAGVPDLAANDIKYDKPSMSAEKILGFIAELLIPVGAGQMFGKTLSTTVNDLSRAGRPPSYEASQLSQYYSNKINDYKLMANQMAFEMTDVATQILGAGRNPIEGAASIINEVAGFDQMVEHIVTDWSNGAQKSVENLFQGIASSDTVVDGISDYATLKSMLKDGAWSRAMKVGDIGSDAAAAMFSHLLPLAVHQNDKVRPTLIIRPYACDDKKRAKADTVFQEMVHGPKVDIEDSAVGLDEAPGLCFFILDANQDGAGICTSRGGCVDKPRPLKPLLGMRRSQLTGGSKFGGIRLEDYAHSLWKGWVGNGKKNGVPTYKVDPKASGGNTANLFDFPISSAGLYNSYFNVCGNDDPSAKLDENKTPDDIHLIYGNIVSAADWSWADASQGYPCRANPPHHS